jgi:hypothetical protein
MLLVSQQLRTWRRCETLRLYPTNWTRAQSVLWSCAVPCERRTDLAGMTKLLVAFCNCFVNAPKIRHDFENKCCDSVSRYLYRKGCEDTVPWSPVTALRVLALCWSSPWHLWLAFGVLAMSLGHLRQKRNGEQLAKKLTSAYYTF